ncbi:MAG: hypothetical protein ACLFM8_03185 [Halobacteriales archaeon]
MGLDVEPPPPPSLEAASADGSYRREELDRHLEAGAWRAAFDRWSATTDMDEATFRIARELDLFARFDFFWDDFAGRVGYHAPGIPEDWREASTHDDLDSWGQVSSINAGLAELGQVVCEVLAAEYLDVDEE